MLFLYEIWYTEEGVTVACIAVVIFLNLSPIN